MEKINNQQIGIEKRQTIGDRIRGKTYEQLYGVERAKIRKEKYSALRKGHIVSDVTKAKITKELTGKKLSPESIRKRTETRRRLFLEGNLKTNKGFKFSEESRRKLSLAHKGKIVSSKTKDLMSKKYKGISFIKRYGGERSKSIIEKISKQLRGRKISPDHRMALIDANTGRECSDETRNKISKSQIGKIIPLEQIRKMVSTRLSHGGYISAMKGKKHTEESKKKMRIKRALQIFPVKDTSIEIKIQDFLKDLNMDFVTHNYMSDIYHSYQCDIYLPKYNIILEADGDYWHGNPAKYKWGELTEWQKNQRWKDDIRTYELQTAGYKVLRLWEVDIKQMDLNSFKIILNNIIKEKNPLMQNMENKYSMIPIIKFQKMGGK